MRHCCSRSNISRTPCLFDLSWAVVLSPRSCNVALCLAKSFCRSMAMSQIAQVVCVACSLVDDPVASLSASNVGSASRLVSPMLLFSTMPVDSSFRAMESLFSSIMACGTCAYSQ